MDNMKTDDEATSTFRLPRELRDEFATLCKSRDLSYSQGIRHLMTAALEAARTGKPIYAPLFRNPPETIKL